MSRKRSTATLTLPKHVHCVSSKYGEYYYYQERRGTKNQGPRHKLPRNPRSAEFWQELEKLQGKAYIPSTHTVDGLIDAFEASPDFGRLAPSSQEKYRLSLRHARRAWGGLPPAGIRPKHVRMMMEQLATSGRANPFLGAIKALSRWAQRYEHIDAPMADHVQALPQETGHKPWTPAQIAAAHDRLTGMVRRAVMLALYTGQRGSDIVRLGWTDVDENGFEITQQKTGVKVWCPILPELVEEMKQWERRPGPFVLRPNGKPMTRKLLDYYFSVERERIPELEGVTLHGLRATSVIRLRRAGFSELQIGDMIGMSASMIHVYCRFADKKESGRAALVRLEELRIVKASPDFYKKA